MGGRGASRKRGGGGGGASQAGDGGGQVTQAQVEAKAAEQYERLPEQTRRVLEQHGVRPQVVTLSEARRMRSDADELHGFVHPQTKTANVILDPFQRPEGGGLRNAGMTALHELAHAYADLTGADETPQFREAYNHDLDRIAKRKMTETQRDGLTYQHYPVDARPSEVWSEGVAVLYGEGRPIPAEEWNNSTAFRKSWRETLSVIRELTGG